MLLGLTPHAVATAATAAQTTFPATAVGQTANSVIITLTAQDSGTGVAPAALTEAIPTPSLAEFAVSDNGTCGASPSLSAGTTCTVLASFSPRFPGVRHGAVVIQTSGGQLLASTLISGVGQGGLPVLFPGQINTVAGDGQWFYQADGVPATQTAIYLPSGLAVDGAGNLFLADTINNRIRRVDAVTNTITTYAGNGTAGTANYDGAATSASLNSPSGLALDGAGNLYIADTGNNAIRRVDATSGRITTIAGTLGISGVPSDGPATSAKLNAPQGLALTPSGDIVIADTGNNVVRLVTLFDGNIRTVAGTGIAGFNGDSIIATDAQLNGPSAVAIRADGAIAIADLSNNRVRLVTLGGSMTTVAGTGTGGYTGDGGSALQAELQSPAAVAFDPAQDLIIADSVNNCIRFVNAAQGTIGTLAGNPTDDRYAGDGGPGDAARMHGPDGLFFDPAGNLWISDRFNNRVREVFGSSLTIGPYSTMKVSKTSQPVAEQLLNAGNQPLTLNTPVLQQAKLDPATTTCGQAALPSSGFCEMGIEFAPQNVGYNITGFVTWNSDAPNVTPMDQLFGQVLSVEPTSTEITSSANPGLLGQRIILSATVTSDDTGRSGTVDFTEGGTIWCSGIALAADGRASCQIPGLSMGTHNILANYSGDNNNAASQSPVFAEIIKQQAALALSVSSSPAVVTSNVTLSLNAADATGTPTGTAIFYDGATALATIPLDASGTASWSTSSFSVGSHALSAQYSGDSANVGGPSPARLLVIKQATTLTVLSSSDSDARVGSSVIFTANVVSNNGPAPTGTVQFQEGTSVLGSVPLTNGSATLPVNTLAPGNHVITAVYGGDTDDATSTSSAIAQIVEQIGTVTTLGADQDPAVAGATVTLTAMVALSAGSTAHGPLSGIVTLQDGSTVYGSAPINASGQASIPLNTLPLGTHAIVATFNGNTNYSASNSAPFSETVQKSQTVVTLGSASSATLAGKSADFAVTVTSSTGTPTGTVTFKEGAAILGTSPLDSHGDATLSTTTLSTGTHSILAVYSGDAAYLSSTSGSLTQTVSLAQTTLTLIGPTDVVAAGTTTQFLAALSSPGIAPTGSITLLDDTAAIVASPVSAAGSFTFAINRLTVGTHTVAVRYSGDSNNAAVVSAPMTVVIRQAPTTATLTSSANSLTINNALLLTASVFSESPAITGSISFFDGGTLLGTSPLGTDGTATLQPHGLSLGSHPITASYSGDTNHANSTSAVVPELVVQSSSVTLASSSNPAVSGLNIVLTAQINGYPLPTGTVTFRDNGAVLSTVPIGSTGTATLTTANLNIGTHTISVTYNGDTNFSVTSTQLSQVVLNAATQTTLSSIVNPAIFGQPLTLAALVSSNGGAAAGSVTFMEGASVLASASLDAHGSASATLATLSPGTHQIVANYSGDSKASASISSPVAVTVKQTTVLAVASTPNPTQTLTTLQLIATITNPGAAPETGTVTFTDSGLTVLGTANLNSTGHATLTLPQLLAGTHTITTSYAGDGANFPSTSDAYDLVVQRRPTSTTVTGAATDLTNPQQMTLIAVVKGTGSVPPSGTVNFNAGNLTLGAADVDNTGVATITVLFNVPTQQVTASYAGDVSYALSQSSSTAITAGTPPQFSVKLSSTNLTLASHQHTSLTVTLSSIKGYTDSISLGCLGLPYAATCTFDQSTLKLSANGTATASLLIDTGNPLGAGPGTSASVNTSRNIFACWLPGALLLLCFGKLSRKTKALKLLVLVLGVSLMQSITGCSGLQVSGTPVGSYSFRVTGTGQGSNTTQTQVVTMVVTQ